MYMELDDAGWYEAAPVYDDDVGQLYDGNDEPHATAPSEFVEFSIYFPHAGGLRPFSFDGRRYLRAIYDSSAQRKVIMAGRQVEKCCGINTLVSMGDGSLKLAKEVKVGDSVSSMGPSGSEMTSGKVTWVSEVKTKRCCRLHTRQGHSVDVALTHPVRRWGRWEESGDLNVGARVAVVRRCGEFTRSSTEDSRRVAITAYLIGDGGLTHGVNFTSLPGPKLDEFRKLVSSEGASWREVSREGTETLSLRLHSGPVHAWMEEDGLLGKGSADKFVPGYVFGLSRRKTALFLNRLWATDGHVKQNTRSKYSLEYCSISETLISQVQALLWKFGIPSKIRTYVPALYKGTDKVAFILRIETQDGVRRFLDEIASIGKSEDVPLPDAAENNNRDTYPFEMGADIKKILASRGEDGWHENRRMSLHAWGLRRSLKYPPTKGRLRQYIDFFRASEGFDQNLVDQLERHLETDLYWDEIVDIEDLGEQECVDFEVDEHHNFVANGFVTHNSTYLGNSSLAYMSMIPGFRVLYVSPSHTQTKVFSRDRIKEPLETSPVLKSFTNTKLLANVLERKLTNRSQITLRFAFLNADRVRGIPADKILIDEFQDVLLDNIPVIEECASHSEYKLFEYSGTPKSMDGALEYYFARYSTQNEWVVPCRHHGTPKDPSSWYWNVLDEDNIGKNGLICDRCGGLIDAADPDCCWAAMNPKPNVEKPFEGYRIPQLMVPWMEWGEILDKQRKYSRAKFHNEVLGRSYDSGTRPLTRQDMQDNCRNDLSMRHYRKVGEKFKNTCPIFMGVDWGCHDEETRILTPDGFKHFRDLTDDDLVAQFDDETRIMSFVKPEVRTIRGWDQPLLHFKNRSMDMMLTHTHRMLTKCQSATKWHVESAGEVAERGAQVYFRGSVVWEGPEVEEFTLPGLPSSAGYSGCDDRVFFMDFWLEFLGYFLSEGGLCMRPGSTGPRPYCLKMSQRATVNPDTARMMKTCMERLGIEYSEFPNRETGDLNWTICGKQFWHWVEKNVGPSGDKKRIPREFLNLSRRQLKILFDAMMRGDGTYDGRGGSFNGCYTSTSKGLCEDFQELCIRLGLRATLSLHKPAEGNRKARYRMSWSSGDDHVFKNPSENVEKVPYIGKVYCCKVPTGFIVTERNGRIAYQGNTGENTYTVVSLGAYLPWAPDIYTYFYLHRFEGAESEPKVQLKRVIDLAREFNVLAIGVDYGGGHWPNDELIRTFGPEKVKKYQWVGNVKQKIKWDGSLARFLCHRTEVMSDMFNAIKRRNVFQYPRWPEFEDPYALDFTNIFSEYNDRLRMNVYKHAPGAPDDSFHSCCYNFLVSFHYRKRADVILPVKEVDREHQSEYEELDII